MERSKSSAAPSSLLHSNLVQATLAWAVVSSAGSFITSFVGQRTTPLALCVFGPGGWGVIFAVTRLSGIILGRIKRVREAATSSILGEGWQDENVRNLGLLLGLIAVTTPLSFGALELSLVAGLETAIPPLLILASRRFDLPLPSATSPKTIAALAGAILIGVTLPSNAPPFYLIVAVVGSFAQVLAWGLIASTWAGSSSAARESSQVAQLLWHVAPISLATSTVLCVFGFLVHQTPLYPPHSYLAFIIVCSTLFAATTYTSLRMVEAFLNSGYSLVDVTSLALPRNLFLLVTARMAHARGDNSTGTRTALAIASVLLFWAHQHQETDSEGPAFLEQLRTRRANALPFLMSAHPPSHPPTPALSHSPPRPNSPKPSAERFLETAPPTREHRSRLTLLPMLALLPWVLLLLSSVLGMGLPPLPGGPVSMYWSNRVGLHDWSERPFGPKTIDIVFSHYDEDLDTFAKLVKWITHHGSMQRFKRRVIVYTKGDHVADWRLRAIAGVDEVHRLDNVGREGGTYLTHILRRWESPPGVEPNVNHDPRSTSHADFTLFLQHHLAWNWVAEPRFDFIDPGRTGFLSFGPYIKSDCGTDMLGNGEFPRMADIYTVFREEFCPPTLQLSAYSAQFIVSRKRILSNPYSKYETLNKLMSAPYEHWIHTEGSAYYYHTYTGPANPALGHSLERSWPTIMGCMDPNIADQCGEDTYDKEVCQCFDEDEQ